jgi:hypothetical protein
MLSTKADHAMSDVGVGPATGLEAVEPTSEESTPSPLGVRKLKLASKDKGSAGWWRKDKLAVGEGAYRCVWGSGGMLEW